MLLPLDAELPIVFCSFLLAITLDGLTQLAGWRESNNYLRFITGFGTMATFLPTLFAIIGHLS